MSQIDTVSVHNELNHLESVTDLRAEFHRHIERADTPRQLPGDVTVEEDVIHVRILGHDIVAIQRPVKVASSYAIEYNFCVEFEGYLLSIWRFYLQDGGLLTQGANIGSTRVCDFNNQYVKNHILVSVTDSLLKSKVFEPSGQ